MLKKSLNDLLRQRQEIILTINTNHEYAVCVSFIEEKTYDKTYQATLLWKLREFGIHDSFHDDFSTARTFQIRSEKTGSWQETEISQGSVVSPSFSS